MDISRAFLNYGTSSGGGSYNNTTPYYAYTGGAADPFGVGNVPDGTQASGAEGLDLQGQQLFGEANTYGGLPQTVWDPYAGRVAPTQTIALTNVNGGIIAQGTAALLLTQLSGVDSLLKGE